MEDTKKRSLSGDILKLVISFYRIQARVYESGELIPIDSHFSVPIEIREYITSFSFCYY